MDSLSSFLAFRLCSKLQGDSALDCVVPGKEDLGLCRLTAVVEQALVLPLGLLAVEDSLLFRRRSLVFS